MYVGQCIVHRYTEINACLEILASAKKREKKKMVVVLGLEGGRTSQNPF